MKYSQWIKGAVTTLSMFVFSVALATNNDATAANSSNPYTYSDPASASTNPSYNDVGRPVQNETDALMLSNDALGLAGPVKVTGGYSDDFGYEVQASFTQMLGFYDAISLLGAYAPQENRIDITWAHAWTEKQRTKVSVERLSQDLDFNYDSGTVTEWVPQYSYGAGYQYLFNKNWLKNAELSAYYAQAQSQDLSTVRFQDETGTYDNYRHIAGATSKGTQATLNVSPWKTGLVGLGLNYDSVNYDTKYENTEASDNSGFGFTLSLEQLISKHVKLNLQGSQREVYDDYTAGISFLTPANLEVGVSGERTLGSDGTNSDSVFSMSLAYFFDDKNRYQTGYSLEDPSQNDLASWASKSPAYMDMVLAAADQKTVRVIESAPTSNNADVAESTSAAVITLTAGEINRVNITDYINSANLTDAQKQAVPTISGGPSEVKFTYDASTKSLVTASEVPASVTDQKFSPLVLLFPADTTTLTKGVVRNTLADRLTFEVAVTATNIPYLNPGFQKNWLGTQTHAKTWVFQYENPSEPAVSPQGPAVMFINPDASANLLATNASYITKSGDANNCYTATPNPDKSLQLLTIATTASSVCPPVGTVTFTVKGCTDVFCSSTPQTIKFTAAPATDPYISGGPITSPTMVSGEAYSPGHTFTNDEVSAGQGHSFDTTASATYVKVFDKTNACTDVTASSNLGLAYATNDTQAILQSTAAIPANLSGHTLYTYLHVTNDAGATADNGTTSACGETPFTSTVVGGPVVPDHIALGDMTVDTAYTYDFMTQGGVSTGSSPLNTSASSATIKVLDQAGAEVSADNLGLDVAITSTDVKLTGIVNPGYAGDTVYVTLNLTNTDGYSASNGASPAYSNAILAGSSTAPSVAGGVVLDNGTQYAAYSYIFPNMGENAVTAGSGEAFNTDKAVTYAVVTDATTGADLSSQFGLTFNEDNTQITLTSGANTLATQDPLNVALYVQNTDLQSANNSANPDVVNVDASTDAKYQPHVTGGLALTDGTQYTNYTSYTFAVTDVYAGEAGSGESFATESSKTYAVVTDPNGVAYSTADANSPFALAFSNSDTQIVLNGVVGQNLQVQGQWNVVLHVQNVDGALADNAGAPDTFQVTANPASAPVVAGGQTLTPGTQYTPYAYTFPTTGAGAVIAGGSTESFVAGASSTYAVVKDSAGVDQSALFSVTVGTDASNDNASQLTLTSGTNNVAVQGNWTVELYVTNNLGQTANNAGNADNFTVGENSAYAPLVGSVGNALNVAVDGSTYTYTYPVDAPPMLAGPVGSGETFNTTATTVSVVDAGNNNASISGFSLVYNTDNTQIIGLKADQAVTGFKGPLNVTYTAVNNDNPGQSVTSTTPDTMATDMISVAANAVLPAATVSSVYSYSFKDSAGLITGTTGLNANSSVTFSDPDAGLTATTVDSDADGIYDDVIVSGTPVSGHSDAPITLTLNLNTPDSALPKTSAATVQLAGTEPTVNGGLNLPAATLGTTYSYTFSNNPAEAGAVYAGEGESFNTSPSVTYATVTGSESGDLSSVFTLTFNGDNTQITMTSGSNLLAKNETLSVVLHVANVDQVPQDNATNPNTVYVGAVPVYLYCPQSADVFNQPATVGSTLYSQPNKAASTGQQVSFAGSTTGSHVTLQLYSASIQNQTLTCNYIQHGMPPTTYAYVARTSVPADAKGYSSDWNGSTCMLNSSMTPEYADSSCQLTYSYTG